MAAGGQQFYSDEEAEQILKAAVKLQTPTGAVDRQRLIEMAAELGVTPDALELAEKSVLAANQESADRKEFIRKSRRGFYSRLSNYIGTNLVLLAINLFTDPTYLWVGWVSGFWGLGVISDFVSTFLTSSDSFEKSFRKWQAHKNRFPEEDLNRYFAILDTYYSTNDPMQHLGGIKALRDQAFLDLKDAKEISDTYRIVRKL